MILARKDQRIWRRISTVIFCPKLIPCILGSKPGLRVDVSANNCLSHATPETLEEVRECKDRNGQREINNTIERKLKWHS
jgi:hypothetical protein